MKIKRKREKKSEKKEQKKEQNKWQKALGLRFFGGSLMTLIGIKFSTKFSLKFFPFYRSGWSDCLRLC